jgi:Rad3-related DNA helicase
MQEYAPQGYTLRDYQIDALTQIASVWDKSEVVVLEAPVGSGKSVLAMTLANWLNKKGKSVAVTTPMVSLQTQYLRDWPDLPTLKGMSHYMCPDMDISCAEVDALLDGKCKGCHYIQCKNNVLESKKALFNVHSYIYLYNNRHNKVPPKDVLIIDEAHTTFDILSEQFEVTLWKKHDKYPDKMDTIGDVYSFLEVKASELIRQRDYLLDGSKEDKKEADKLNKKIDKYERVMAGIKRSPTTFFLQPTEMEYRGKLEEAIRVRPLNLRGMPEILWRGKQKVVLMTGTIHKKDVDMLGLCGKRVSTITVKNPIPANARPVVIPMGLNMGYKYQEANLPAMARLIKELANKYNGKGVVHITYGLSDKLSKYLKDDIFMFHNSETREETLDKFMRSDGKKVLMACGMTTGLDLAGEEYQWQAIAKIAYPSLGDPLVAKWLKDDPEWFQWLSVRQVLQATGRICRGPNDYGVTYILDNTAGTMDGKRMGLLSRASRMIPQYFKEAVKYG